MKEKNVANNTFTEALLREVDKVKVERNELFMELNVLKQHSLLDDQHMDISEIHRNDDEVVILQEKIAELEKANSSQVKALKSELKKKEDKISELNSGINELDILNKKKDMALISLGKQLEETQIKLNNLQASINNSVQHEGLKRFDSNSHSNTDKSRVSSPDISIEIDASYKPSTGGKYQDILGSMRISPDVYIKTSHRDRSENSLRVRTERSVRSKARTIRPVATQPFKTIVYLCQPTLKQINILYIDNNILFFTLNNSRKINYNIPIKNVTAIRCSISDSFLIEFDFIDDAIHASSTLILEAPNSKIIREVMKSSSHFRAAVKTIKNLEIEKNVDFRNAALNCFTTYSKSGFLERFINSIFINWEFVCCLQLKGSFVIYKLPSKFVYSKYFRYKRYPEIYYLDNYNIITDQMNIGLTRNNLFALKIKNEEIDLIFACLQFSELESWVSAFN